MIDFEKTGGVIALVGLGLAAIAGVFHLTGFGLAGLAVLGIGVICWGLSGVVDARMVFFEPGVRHRQSYYGLAARAWGILICMAGASLVGFSFILLLDREASFDQLISSPLAKSMGMLLGGLAGMLYATALISSRSERGRSLVRKAMSLPAKVLGIFILSGSMVLTAAGATRIVAPQIYERAIQYISDKLPRAPQLHERRER